jgi:hypothetical protein
MLGIRQERMAPYTPLQNGVVERCSKSAVGTTRYMLKAKELPNAFWGRRSPQ